MIRITNLKDYYTPLSVNGNIVKIAFDYEPLFDTDEDGNKIESNVGTWSEHVFKEAIFKSNKGFHTIGN